jgi:hypothetical protein
MKKIDINRDNGTILLPNRYLISPSLTRDSFQNSEMFSRVQCRNPGTISWIHYSFPGGKVSGRNLLVSLCFYDQGIIDAHMTVDMYPPGPKDWSDYSLDLEAAAKKLHDNLLEKILGKPVELDLLPNMNLNAGHECLARPLKWVFPWGIVRSAHDFKGGGTYMIVSYGNRREEAAKAYYRDASKR